MPLTVRAWVIHRPHPSENRKTGLCFIPFLIYAGSRHHVASTLSFLRSCHRRICRRRHGSCCAATLNVADVFVVGSEIIQNLEDFRPRNT